MFSDSFVSFSLLSLIEGGEIKFLGEELISCQNWLNFHFGQGEGHFCEGRVISYLVQEEGYF